VFVLNIVLASILMIGIIATLYQMHLVKNHKKINQIISREIEALYDHVQIELKKNTDLIKRAKSLLGDAKQSGEWDPLASPEMLASVITVIVAKFGNLRLGADDFAVPGETDYVSVYIDTTTNDLILSLDHGLAASEAHDAVHFGLSSDDDTYH
jgi:hypothetical protein